MYFATISDYFITQERIQLNLPYTQNQQSSLLLWYVPTYGITGIWSFANVSIH